MPTKARFVLVAFYMLSCGGHAYELPPPKPISVTERAPGHALTPEDVLGPRPIPAVAAPFIPPAPTVYTGPNGLTVWFVERHTLPIVSLVLVVPFGAASDPKGQEGLALATANMLDEGAGKMGALELARAVEDLGASLDVNATRDYSYVSLTVLQRNLDRAMQIFGDVVARPRFDAAEWKRTHDLWLNDLRNRTSDPEEVADVVSNMSLFGAAHPYGHPTSGSLASAGRVDLRDAKRFYANYWRPDGATLIVVGDTTRAAVDARIAAAWNSWKAPPGARPSPVTPAAPKLPTWDGRMPPVHLVDRPDAPQSVVSLVRPGVAASDADAPALTRVNAALGGSFTSRLNQDLREEHGYTYGAHSHLIPTRGVGALSLSAAVRTDSTGDAIKALVSDALGFASGGLTDDEVEKTRLLSRAELVEHYESVEGVAMRLARDAALGLAPDYEARASVRRDAASKGELDVLAKSHFDPKDAVLVVVGSSKSILAGLHAAGMTHIEPYDSEGHPTKHAERRP